MRKGEFTYIWVTPSVQHEVPEDGRKAEMARRWQLRERDASAASSARFFRIFRRVFRVHGRRSVRALVTWNQRRPDMRRYRAFGNHVDPTTLGEVLYRGLKESV